MILYVIPSFQQIENFVYSHVEYLFWCCFLTYDRITISVALLIARNDLFDRVLSNERDIQQTNKLLQQLMGKVHFQPLGDQLSSTARKNDLMDES